MRKDLLLVLHVAAIVCAVTLLPIPARAASDLAATSERAEKLSKDFTHRLDEEMDKLVIDGRPEEKRFDELSEKLRSRLDEVHHEVKEADDSEAKEELHEALTAAREINDAMPQYAFSPALKDMWNELRADLNEMALHFGLAGLPVLAAR